MSIWRSPVLYLGLLLFVIVAGALAAPFIVDWNSYRSELEDYGAHVTGRKVAIEGPISVRLFPWPRLSVEDLRVSNAPGFGEAPMMQAGKMTVNLALAGLVSGQIKVESVMLDNPIVNLAVDQKGGANWHFNPQPMSGDAALLGNVQLDQIAVTNGIINLADARHRISQSLTAIVGNVSAQAANGPWRAQGTGVLGATPVEFSVSTGEISAAAPYALVVHVSPADGALPALRFDGKGQGSDWSGQINLDPVVTADGRTSLAGFVKPLSYAAQLDLHGDVAAFSKVHIAPADPKDNGTLIEGAGRIDFSHGITGDISLSSPLIDLDKMASDAHWRLDKAGGVMGFLNALMARAPQDLDLNTNLDVTALTAGGENLENVSLRFSAASGGLRVKDFKASLPGRSAVKFSGLIFPGNDSAELGGNLALESSDTRALASWLLPEARDWLAQIWTGRRGRLKLSTDINLSRSSLALQNTNYELDSEPGQGQLKLTLGQPPTLDAQLTANEFDLGSYFAGSISPNAASQVIGLLLPGESGMEKKVKLDFGKLVLNGVTAQNLNVEFEATVDGFNLKRFDIGSVEGAELRGDGLVLQGPDGANGEVKFALGAPRPQGLLRLMGAFPNGLDPAWAAGLGQTDLRADITVKPGKNEPLVGYSLTGTSGAYKVVGTGTVTDLQNPDGKTVGFSGTIYSSDARDFLRLLALDPKGRANGDGQLAVTLAGKVQDGFKSVVDFEGFGGTATFDGRVNLIPGPARLAGDLKLLFDRSDLLGEALGWPLAGSGPFGLTTKFVPSAEGTKMDAVALKAGEQEFTGSGSIGPGAKVALDLSGGEVRLSDLAALSVAPWNGPAGWPSGRFSAGWPFGLEGSVKLKPAILVNPLGASLADAVISLQSDEAGRKLEVSGTDGASPLKLSASLSRADAGFTLSGDIVLPVDLGAVYGNAEKPLATPPTGTALLKLQVGGAAASPAAMLNALHGSGSLSSGDLRVANLSPDPLFAALADAKSNDEVAKLFGNLDQGDGVSLAAQELKVQVQNGVVSADPQSSETKGAELSFIQGADLSAGQVSSVLTIQSKAQVDLPAFKLVFSGVPGMVTEKVDATALSNKIGTALIAKDMVAMEQLQKEQAKIAADAAAQAEADKARFEAFQSQRAELRLYQRMEYVFAKQRALDALRAKAALDAAISYGYSILKDEKRRFSQGWPN